jgi:DNA polymerase (family 10)
VENAEVARILAEIGDLLELTGGNAFKVRAYRRAAQVIDLHPGSISELWRAGGLAVEDDTLPTGALDLPEAALGGLDCVVAAIHSRLADPAPKNTERIVRAIGSGVVHVLGHPTGREIGARDAYALDLERVLEVARREGVALEVNAMPERLDLTDVGCRAAKAAGVPVVISTDAHDASHLATLRYGVWVARRGWLEAKDVLNTLPIAELRRRLTRAGASVRSAPGR